MMRLRRLTGVLFVLALAVWATPDLHACGDKFLVGTPGALLELRGVLQPTMILVYHPPGEPSADESEEPDYASFEAALREVGHGVAVVTDAQGLYRAAATGKHQVILMELADARTERDRLAGVAPEAALLPFVDFPTRVEYSAAKKEFGQVVKTPTTLSRLLKAVEKSRASQGRR